MVYQQFIKETKLQRFITNNYVSDMLILGWTLQSRVGWIRVITKLPNSEQSYKGKVKAHNYINRQNQSTTGKLWKRNDPDLVQAFLKKFILNYSTTLC